MKKYRFSIPFLTNFQNYAPTFLFHIILKYLLPFQNAQIANEIDNFDRQEVNFQRFYYFEIGAEPPTLSSASTLRLNWLIVPCLGQCPKQRDRSPA